MYNLGNIIGLSVVAVKSEWGQGDISKHNKAKYIMFSDGFTFIRLSDDVTESAYVAKVIHDKTKYNEILQNLDANEDI